MKTIFNLMFICLFLSCHQKEEKKTNENILVEEVDIPQKDEVGKLQKPIPNSDQNSIYLISDDWTYDKWELSEKKSSYIRREFDTLQYGYRIRDYYSHEKNIPTQVGYLLDLNGNNAKNAKAFGQWFLFQNDSRKIASTGFYKEGLRDSIWITNYEDYPIPKLKFYKNGKESNFEGDVLIKDYENRIWFEVEDIKIGEFPKSKMSFYRYDIDIILEYQFVEGIDSINVKQKIYELSSMDFVKESEYKIVKEF